jgi:immune inhibitor A
MDKSEKTILVVLLSVIGGCFFLALLCGGILFIANRFLPDATQTPTEIPALSPTPTSSVDLERIKTANKVLDLVTNTIIPVADLNQLAEKFEGKQNIPSHLTTAPIQYKIGDPLDFYVLDTDTNVTRVVKATLQYETDEVYFWVEDGIEYSKRDLKTVMDRFSSQIYPTDQEIFGKEWIPGVDNDPHVYIFYGNGLGTHVAGFTSSLDVVLPVAHEYSNAHEMFYISAESQPLSDPYTLSVMAHEMQHLILGYHDANEELWLNEGFSELATLLNGYDAGGFDFLFSYNPDLQLNYWPGDPNETDAHYGASFLFVTYMLDRFGEEFTRAVVSNPENGLVSIDKVMIDKQIKDSSTGEQETADKLFSDWVAANYLKDKSIGDGRFDYSNYTSGPKMGPTQTLYDCANATVNGDVHQYGSDYISFSCSGNYEVTFSGQPVVDVMPLPAGDHGKFWWSNRGDSSDIVLSREFDFTGVTAPIQMTYDTWYDIETDYDYLYLMASVEGGPWRIIDTPSCTRENPTGNSYGCAYNGQTGEWITEKADLSDFAGKKVTISFDYVTDGAVTGDGFTLDNVAIPAINYQADFESDTGGWVPEGFILIENVLPQPFLVSLINTNDPNTPVTNYVVNAGESLVLDVKVNSATGDTVLIVSASNRFTRQTADYSVVVKEK